MANHYNSAKWEDFFKFVRPDVQGCPVAMVREAIRNACIEFCEKSLIWQQEIYCGDLVEGERKYGINTIGDDATLVMPVTVTVREEVDGTINQYPVQKTSRSDLDALSPQWRLRQDKYPKFFYMESPNVLCFVGEPTDTIPDAIHMLAAVKPTRDADEIPQFLLTDWAETIAAGALSYLHSLQGKVWSKSNLVNYYIRKFRAGVSRAKSKAYKSWVAQSKTMLPVYFNSSRRNYVWV